MKQDSDRFPDRESAQEYLAERGKEVVTEETTNGTLLEALTKPV